ncbi:FxsA family protein [Listeria costaricensis]|uniref:FxsA family protein n=1 Tax=Listeria costaricensis TaxID=2026604 RepID=UPI000C07F695|nr:FxsA family protein [Listeria costaricensis]
MKRFILYWAAYGLIELIVYIWLFEWIGLLPLILIQVASSVFGIYMFKKLGGSFLFQLRDGRTVAPYLLDSICFAIAAFFLTIPGIVTTLCGLLLFIPFIRNRLKPKLAKWLDQKTGKHTHFYFFDM